MVGTITNTNVKIPAKYPYVIPKKIQKIIPTKIPTADAIAMEPNIFLGMVSAL
jgi:hypothetical protein